MDFFAAAINGGDLTKYYEIQKQNMDNFSLNTALIDEYFDAITALIAALNEGSFSSESDRQDLKEVVIRYADAGTQFIRSQPGMEDYPDCANLRADPRNDEFFRLADTGAESSRYMYEHSAPAETFFNAQTADYFVRFTALIAEVSARAVQAKTVDYKK